MKSKISKTHGTPRLGLYSEATGRAGSWQTIRSRHHSYLLPLQPLILFVSLKKRFEFYQSSGQSEVGNQHLAPSVVMVSEVLPGWVLFLPPLRKDESKCLT